NPYTAKIILETGLNITKTYYLFATESEASNASATSVAISQNAINATAVASTNKTEWTFKVNATKDHNKTKLLVVVETDADHKSNLGTGNVTYSSTVSTPVIESVQYNDGKEVTSGNPYTAKIILETGLNITKTYYLFATESEASNASATSVAISQNAINATAVASTNKTEWTFKVNATKDHNKTKLLVVVETDADHKSNLGTGNVTYSPTVSTPVIESVQYNDGKEVTSGNPYTAKIILETGLNITKTYYLFATESEASNASATSVAISQNAINATAVASTNKTEWTFKVNATKDHNKTKLLVVVETDADHKSNLGTGNVSFLPVESLGKSPYLSVATVVAKNHTEPFKAGEYIPVKVTLQHFAARTRSFQYRFYADQEWIDLSDDNVTEVKTQSAIKKLHADEGKTYLLNIPVPKYEDIKEDGTVKLQIKLAASKDQAQSNIIETEVSLQKQQYVAPSPDDSKPTPTPVATNVKQPYAFKPSYWCTEWRFKSGTFSENGRLWWSCRRNSL
ncbi:hypothetical protein TVAG_193980, partial [Trichomonas vaginalis G3]